MNRSPFRLPLILIFSALMAGASLAATGPTSMLYVTNYGEFAGGTITGLDLFQGLSEASYPTGNLVDSCIGVAGGDVRTMGYTDTYSGSRFNLAGGPLVGGPYLNTIVASQLHDGTSDGRFNYSVNYSTGDVIEFDRNWASPNTLFNAWGTLSSAGYITLDAADGSFWLSEWGGPDRVEHRTHGGALISSFNWGFLGTAGLALDPADGTLWTSDGNSTLYQFSQAGVQLQSYTYNVSGQLLGMEFEVTPTPEPATLATLAIGAIALMRRRRR